MSPSLHFSTVSPLPSSIGPLASQVSHSVHTQHCTVTSFHHLSDMSSEALLKTSSKELREPKVLSNLCSRLCVITSLLASLLCLLFRDELSRVLMLSSEALRPPTCANHLVTPQGTIDLNPFKSWQSYTDVNFRDAIHNWTSREWELQRQWELRRLSEHFCCSNRTDQ